MTDAKKSGAVNSGSAGKENFNMEAIETEYNPNYRQKKIYSFFLFFRIPLYALREQDRMTKTRNAQKQEVSNV
jgi:hypothetical protein